MKKLFIALSIVVLVAGCNESSDDNKNLGPSIHGLTCLEFKDAGIQQYALQNWDTNKDKCVTSEEASHVTSVPDSAFAGNQNVRVLDDLNQFKNLTTIGNSAFSGCTNLTSADLQYVTLIGTSAFANCTNLISAKIPNATNIPSDAFDGCTKLDIDINHCPETCTAGCNEDGSCKSSESECPSTCKNGCKEDGSCKSSESECPLTCKNGCNADNSCKCLSTCPDNCNADGSCKNSSSDPYTCDEGAVNDGYSCITGAGNCLESDKYYKFTSTKWKLTKDKETIVYPWHTESFIESEMDSCLNSAIPCSPRTYCKINWGDGTHSFVKFDYTDEGSAVPDTITGNSHTYEKAGTYTITTTDCSFNLFHNSTCHKENCIFSAGHYECDIWCEPNQNTCNGLDRLIEFTE